MLLKIQPLTEQEKQKIRNADLKERSDMNPLTDNRKQYLVLMGKKEVAYLSLDIPPGKDYIVLYEIFVTQTDRQRGIGNTVLQEAENIAKIFCFSKIRVNPKSLDDSMTDEQLIKWYKDNGYLEIEGQLEKNIKQTSHNSA